MKFFKKSTLLVLALGLCLVACNHDNVAPTEGSNRPSLAGAVGDPHPALDTVCQNADTMYLIREDDGSPYVNKCFGPAGPITCPQPQPKWGYLEMVEGYYGDTNFVDCNFTLAPGWYCDFTNWAFGFGNYFTFDQNGIPVITQDWSSQVTNPVENKWQVRVNLQGKPESCYDVALRVTAVRLNLFGAVTPGSSTVLWGDNDHWDETGHPAQSNSRWLMHFCPERCLETPPPTPIDTTTVCAVVYTGLTCTGNNLNCTTLHPTATESGVISYAWNTGATTQDLNVCPTASAPYTVGISVDGTLRHVIIYNVNVVDVSCSIPVSNGGGGYGGGGCGNGGSGSGNSGNGNSTCGNGDQVTSSTGVCNTSNALGSPNNSGASFTNTGHKITIKLDHTMPAGTQYKIYWKKSGSGTASLKVSESQGGSSFTLNSTITTTSSSYGYKTLTTTVPTRYLKLESQSSTDLYVDAITYCYTPVVPTTPGVKVCHIPPGNPNGATTVCVRYSDLGQHMTNVCPSNNGGGGNSGNGGSGSGNGCNYGNGGSGSGNGWNGWGNGGNCGNGGGNSGNGGSGSGNGWGGWGNGCGNNGGGGNGGGGNPHPGDMIGACNSNPCI
jgi:hypothetical protein